MNFCCNYSGELEQHISIICLPYLSSLHMVVGSDAGHTMDDEISIRFKKSRWNTCLLWSPLSFSTCALFMQTKILCGMSLSLLLINLAAVLERADETLLPAVYKEVSQAFKASPSDLGSLTFIRTVVQALCSPLAGMLAMQYYRPSIIGLGTLFWALSTAAVAFSLTFTQCALSRAINGIGLAIVVPALQSFIADSYTESGRGVAFGWLNLVGSVGAIAGSTSATVMAGYNFGGIPGWRLAFFLMACVSSLIGWLVHTFVVDPRDRLSKSGISIDRITNGYAILFLCCFCFSLAHGVQLAKYT